MIALGYVRRSKASADDERHGRRVVSVELPTAKIREYADSQGWTVVEIVTDDGVSGGKRERLERLAARVKVTKATRVVVYHLDRSPATSPACSTPCTPSPAAASSSTW